MSQQVTNANCIARMSRYRAALRNLKALHFVKVFSTNLADAIGVPSVQVRKDFSLFGITGRKKGGYQIDELIQELDRILGKEELHRLVIVGAGLIGRAMMHYAGFGREGFQIAAAFDDNPQIQDEKAEIPVLPPGRLVQFVQQEGIRFAILAVPAAAAQEAMDMLVLAGVRGVLNFAPVRLRHPEHVIVNSVNIILELEKLVYFEKFSIVSPGQDDT